MILTLEGENSPVDSAISFNQAEIFSNLSYKNQNKNKLVKIKGRLQRIILFLQGRDERYRVCL